VCHGQAVGVRRSGVRYHLRHPAVPLAFVHAALGNADRAFARAIDRHETDLPYLAVDPLFDPLRKDSRFAAVLR
jgi:hypothetical protein